MGNTLPKSLFVFHFQKRANHAYAMFRLLQRELFGTKSIVFGNKRDIVCVYGGV